MPGRLLDRAGAAEYLGLTESQIRGLVFRRQIPFMKVGKSVKFDVRHLDRWIEQSHQAAS
jgi:excisionase family DNA binding protein